MRVSADVLAVSGTVFDWLWNALKWTWHDPDGYNIVSGPVADVTLIGGAIAIYRKHNCHAKGCWRVGRHPVDGTSYIVCRKHHPDDHPTAEQILAEHHAARHAKISHQLHNAQGQQSAAAEPVHKIQS